MINNATITTINERARSAAIAGLGDPAWWASQIAESVKDGKQDIPLQTVKKAVAAAYLQRAKEQAAWPRPTDCEKLEKAFARLEANAILVGRNPDETQSGSHDVMQDRLVASKGSAAGYVYFHGQDLRNAMEKGVLSLGFGSLQENDELDLAIAQNTVKVLAAQGLIFEWDGTLNKRIKIALQWRYPISDAVLETVRRW